MIFTYVAIWFDIIAAYIPNAYLYNFCCAIHVSGSYIFTESTNLYSTNLPFHILHSMKFIKDTHELCSNTLNTIGIYIISEVTGNACTYYQHFIAYDIWSSMLITNRYFVDVHTCMYL